MVDKIPCQCAGGESSRFPTNVVEEVPGSPSVWGGQGSRFPISVVVVKVPGSPPIWWRRFQQVPHQCGGEGSHLSGEGFWFPARVYFPVWRLQCLASDLYMTVPGFLMCTIA